MTRPLLLLLLLAGPALAQEESPPTEGTLKVVSYNVHGLPGFVTGDDTLARQAEIGPRLLPFDVVGLQEDFMQEGHARLVKGVDHARQLSFADVIQGRVYGSGLSVLARPRVVAEERAHFTTFHGVMTHANDGLASKGFQMVRLSLAPGVEVDVYNSHLDAGGAKGDREARAIQARQLTGFMQRVSRGRAIVFLGDTNLKRDKRPDDAKTLRAWLSATGLRCACHAERERCCGRIDRVLYRSGAGLELKAKRWAVVPGFKDAKGRDLSDHEPIGVSFRWRRGWL